MGLYPHTAGMKHVYDEDLGFSGESHRRVCGERCVSLFFFIGVKGMVGVIPVRVSVAVRFSVSVLSMMMGHIR